MPHSLPRSPYAVGLRAQLDCPDVWRTQALAALAVAGITVEGVGPGRHQPRPRPRGLARRSTTGASPRSPTCSSASRRGRSRSGRGPRPGSVRARAAWRRPSSTTGRRHLPDLVAAAVARPRRRRRGAGPGRLGCRRGAAHLADVVALRPRAAPHPATVGAPPLLRVRLVRHGLTGRAAHHHSLSSLPSIARRCAREQVSQKRCGAGRSRRPWSTSGASPTGAWVPQRWQVTVSSSLTRPTLLPPKCRRAGTSSP